MSSYGITNLYMQEALKQAKLAYQENEIPVGAVIVNSSNKEIICVAHNLVEQQKNPLLHAEIIAINNACAAISSKNLSGYDIYVTLEPCAMCAAAISYSRIDRLYYGASDLKQGAVENGIRFFTQSSCFHRPEIYPSLSEQCSVLMKDFFQQLRFNSVSKSKACHHLSS